MKGNHKHGQYVGGTRSPTFISWRKMVERCSDPNDISYKNYGARGINYDPRWKDFHYFMQDMGERPEGTSLDRIDNQQDYCKENCRWATKVEQQNNTRGNRYITYQGKTQTVSQWSRETGLLVGTLWARLNKGYTVDDIFYHGNLKQRVKCG